MRSAAWPCRCLSGTPDTCIQCNQCAFVCPHATIRPFALTDAEMAQAPAQTKHVPVKGKVGADMQYVLAVSPLDCMGCGAVRHPVPDRLAHHDAHRR